MINDSDLEEIVPQNPTETASVAHVEYGSAIPKPVRITTFSPDEWEQFIEEWASALKDSYQKVRRLGGAGDLGVDVVGFVTEKGFQGEWDNYQCKRLDHPLRPSNAWVEIGKIIYYSFIGEYTPPTKHFFVCSKGIGTTLEILLNKPSELKKKTKENWVSYCETKITSKGEIPLTGELERYFDGFNFEAFTSKSHLELIETHSLTPNHSVRFGGGLPARPLNDSPPNEPTHNESRYIRHLLDAYAEEFNSPLLDSAPLDDKPKLKRDYLRQRERFYNAEGLRNFARDTVPSGTFEALQEEVFQGVIDTTESVHPNGLARLRATVSQAAQVSISSNPLSTTTKAQDKQGICHQLANSDRLKWVETDD